MTDSAYIQEWPAGKLTVEQLRSVYGSLQLDGVVRDIDPEQLRIGERKIKAALDKAESATHWVVKHTRNGYLKRRGHSDEPSLEWIDDPQEAMHMSREAAQFIVDREVFGQHQAPDPTAAERWSVEEIEPSR